MKSRNLLLLLPALLLASCDGAVSSSNTQQSIDSQDQTHESNSSDSSAGSDTDGEQEIIGEDELGGGQYDDEVNQDSNDISGLVMVLDDARQVRNYTYETTYELNGSTSKVIDYYGNHYFYEKDLTNPENSFGLAEESTASTPGNIFRFYVDDTKEGLARYTPSLYYYDALSASQDPAPLTDLFGAFGITGIHNLTDSTMDELTGVKISDAEYLITSTSTYSVFQFMTQMGSSIASIMTECRLEVLDFDALQLKITIGLGETGTITSVFTPTAEPTYGDLDTALEDGKIKGVESYADVIDFYENKLNKNNYTINYDITENNRVNQGSFTAKLTQNYYLIDFADEYNAMGYDDFGYMFLPANTQVQLETENADGTFTAGEVVSHPYSGCYEFTYKAGQVHFVNFLGPNETDTVKFVEVQNKEDLEALPADQKKEGWLYIVLSENNAYQYTIIDGTGSEPIYGFTLYTEWYDGVSDFYINDAGATFYTSAATVGHIARYYLEKDETKENTYYTTDSSLLSVLSSGLFGWGFFDGTSWYDYVQKTETVINKDAEGNIASGDIHLYVLNNSRTDLIDADMHITAIGTTEIPALAETYRSLTALEA